MSLDIIHKNQTDLYQNYLLIKNIKDKAVDLFLKSLSNTLPNNQIEIKEKQYIIEYTLYVLLLDGEALYVGKTERDFEIRLKEHRSGVGSEFTKTFKYGEIIPLINDTYKSDDRHHDHETNLTFILMRNFGYKNVRGGTFNNVVIKKDPTKNQNHIDKYPDYTVEDYITEIYDKIKKVCPDSKLLKIYEENNSERI
jgi:predicted GIY-YIG superfamily endonuclease